MASRPKVAPVAELRARPISAPPCTSATVIAQLNEEVDRDLYPKLILLKTLSPYNGQHLRRNSSSSDSDECRRCFLDAFAYLCDIEKGGATVTAAALQKLNSNIVLWLAANEGIRPNVMESAKQVLTRLKNVDAENRADVEEGILDMAVSMAKKRIKFYRAQFVENVAKCSAKLGSENKELEGHMLEDTEAFMKWLQDLVQRDQLIDWLDKMTKARNLPSKELVSLCYEYRSRPDLDALRHKSEDENDDCFGRLVHYIGRLGAHKSKVRSLVDSMVRYPVLKDISNIETASSPPRRQVNVVLSAVHHYDMVLKICRKESVVNQVQAREALHALCDLELEHGLDLQAVLDAEKSIITRVHAELILVDLFARKSLGFYKNDRYVGCSKPACYFCFNWIDLHYGSFVRPATHNKIILGCRGLDMELNPASRKRLKNMYQRMIQQVEKDIIRALLERPAQESRRGIQYMSTEGSSRAPSLSTTLSQLRLK